MAKHKIQRPLFDILSKERTLGALKATGGAEASPLVRRTAAGTAADVHRYEAPPAAGAVEGRRLALTYYQAAVIGVAVLCALVFFYVLGKYVGERSGLPEVEKHPTFSEVRQTAVTPGLVPPPPPSPPPSPAAGQETAPRPTGTEPSAAATPAATQAVTPPAPPVRRGPQFRVRIARWSVSQPEVTARLQTYLAQQGIETELETRSGVYILYGKTRFTDRKESDALAVKINEQLEAFEKQTRIPTSKDAYSIQATKE
jgi:hypothetical protein